MVPWRERAPAQERTMAFDFFHRGRAGDRSTVDQTRIPPGQVQTQIWPVLHYGSVPRADLQTWDFRIAGMVDNPLVLSWGEFQRLPRTLVHSDIHCVTRWSRLDNTFEGV